MRSIFAISAAEDPLLRGFGVAGTKVLHRGRYEMRRELLGDVAHRRIGDDRDLLDPLVVVAHEAEVRRHGAEAVPARKPRRIDDDARELALRFDEWIDRLRELREVFLLQCGLRPQMEDAVRCIEGVLKHGGLLTRLATVLDTITVRLRRRLPVLAVERPNLERREIDAFDAAHIERPAAPVET